MYLDIQTTQSTNFRNMVPLGGSNPPVPDGAHLTHLCLDFPESLDIGSSYVGEGLTRNETVLLVAGKDYLDKLLAHLQKNSIDIGMAKTQGRLHISHGTDTPGGMAALISQTIVAAKGCFRLFGDMTWAREKQWSLKAIRQLEEMGNSSQDTPGRLYLCQYPLAVFSGEELMMAAETHKFTLYKGVLRESPYFTVN
jgi:transcriptional repressor of dcmA and dcmR